MRSLGYSVREHSEHLARREVNGSIFFFFEENSFFFFF